MANRFMTKGRIVLVPFPFDDMTASKVRPAVCLTDPIGPYRHVVVAFVSSQMPVDIAATDVVLDPQREDFGATGLRVASVLRLHRLVTLTTALNPPGYGQVVPSLARRSRSKAGRAFWTKSLLKGSGLSFGSS